VCQQGRDGSGEGAGAELLSAEVDTEADAPVRVPATWRVAVAGLLSVIGLGISVYLTVDHFAKIPLVCSDSGLINCTKVTTSAQSYFPPFTGWPHVPVALLGLCFYVVMVAINSPMAWRATDRRVHLARMALMGLGMAFALYLVACELVVIGNICLWCTSVHVVTFLLFVLVMTTVPAMLGWGGGPAYADEDPADQSEEYQQI
jgi:uncharacterized membrane protein